MDESLWEALNSLSKTYREVLLLHYFAGMTSNEMARALGTSPGAIRVRLNRARTHLKEEMLAMMDTAFEGQRLQSSFTFRIVEAVKRIKINSMPRVAGLPWGISAAVGIIIIALSFNPHMSITGDMAISAGSPVPMETKILKTGEIPVDILKIDKISVIANNQGDNNAGQPIPKMPQKEFLMAPHAEGGTWTKRTNMPTSRHGHASAETDGKIYVFGGSSLGGIFQSVEEYDPATDKWSVKSPMPTSRGYISASEVDGKIYVIGGGVNTTTICGTVEEYDPGRDLWVAKSPMPTPRGGLSASAVNGKIYAIGGTQLDAGKISLATVEEYDPETDTWMKKADMPTARAMLSTCAVYGKIYAIGGDTKPAFLAKPGNCVSTVEEYDPMTDTWARKRDMPTPRSGFSACVLNGKILVIGGNDKGSELFLSIVEEYDPTTDTLTKKADIPTGRLWASADSVDKKVYVIGGTQNWRAPVTTLSTVEEFIDAPIDDSNGVESINCLPTTWGLTKSR